MNRHHIGKIALDLHWRGQEDGMSLQQQVARLLQDSVLPALEPLFDELADKDTVIAIEHLDLDLGQVPANDWQRALTGRLMEAIRNEIRRRLLSPSPGERLEALPIAQSDFEHWLWFLEHGYLAVRTGTRTESERRKAILETLSGQAFAVEQLWALMRRSPVAIKRLLRQHDLPFLHRIATITTLVSLDAYIPVVREMLRLLGQLSRYPEQLPGGFVRKDGLTDGDWLALARQTRDVFEELFWFFFWQLRSEQPQAPEPERMLQAVFAERIPPAQLPAWYAWLQRVLYAERPAASLSALNPLLENIVPHYPMSVVPQERNRPATRNPADAPVDATPLTGSDRPDAGFADTLLHPDSTAPPGGNWETAHLIKEPSSVSDPPWPPEAGVTDMPVPVNRNTEQGESPDLGPYSARASQETDLRQLPKADAQPNSVLLRPGEFQYVQNAGLILLHPFLPAFFKENHLVSERGFRTPAARQKAVYLLHYLATGISDAAEYDLLLPKLLCAWPANEPLERSGRITANARAAGMDLLRAVLGHWGKLGGSSPDALREGFLQRRGKLTRRDTESWLLQIEQSGIDILLNSLPWGISIVKLPWMPQMIHIEWNYG